LHVKWTPPPTSGVRAVRALAVDNEPEPFWDGKDEADRVEAWRLRVEWSDEWGRAEPAVGLNGPSGDWVVTNIVDRLGYNRMQAWMTDCLDTYRASTAMQKAVDTVYGPFAARLGLPAAELLSHPSENQIVREAIAEQLTRLRSELGRGQPDVVVTLGNAALRVLAAMADDRPAITKLVAENYGKTIGITISGVQFSWLPLAHPAAPTMYQEAHAEWRV
jgi:uracil-DNA glycosylase